MVLSRGAQPSIPAGRRPACPAFQQLMRSHDLLISLSRQPGPSQVKEPKGHESYDSSSTAFQRHNPRPQPHKLPLALAKPSYPNNGLCHAISSAHAEPTPGPCQPTCRTIPTAAPQ